MKTRNSRHPLVNLPSEVQGTLYLIKEELKSRKLFQVLQEAGFENCYFQPSLDSMILQSLDMDGSTDETFGLYNTILNKRSRKIKADHDSIMKHALKAYHELLKEKEKLAST